MLSKMHILNLSGVLILTLSFVGTSMGQVPNSSEQTDGNLQQEKLKTTDLTSLEKIETTNKRENNLLSDKFNNSEQADTEFTEKEEFESIRDSKMPSKVDTTPFPDGSAEASF